MGMVISAISLIPRVYGYGYIRDIVHGVMVIGIVGTGAWHHRASGIGHGIEHHISVFPSFWRRYWHHLEDLLNIVVYRFQGLDHSFLHLTEQYDASALQLHLVASRSEA
ncbi:hypothetical protein I7I51_04121 [Histoplasma capsulatum]|uniref:Uncharacterized protein n=1 Tax=Ajellomyces capsulatus TaxID=5037 RepID=A0A8A1MBF6_AJECA|nr:hypothetical protein I7I51_04121 [Histoplasma capsulatum]